MQPSDPANWSSWLAGALIGIFLALNFSGSRLKSPTSDEPAHLAAGLSYFVTHEIYRANPQHPPLLKELSALSLMAAGIRWPHSEQADYLVNGDDPARVFGLEWPIGNSIIRDNGPDRVMFWARLPFILVAALLALLLYLWGRQLLGPPAAVGAVFVYCLDPTILAHSYLVTTDIGLAAFTVLAMFALWSYVTQPGWRRLVFCGLALGAALAAKFSALLLLPVVALLLLARLRWPPEPVSELAPAFPAPPASSPPMPAPRSGVPMVAAGKRKAAEVRRKDLCPCGSGRKYKNCHGAWGTNRPASLRVRQIRWVAGVLGVLCLVAFLVIEVTYFFPADLTMYAKCARMVNADHNPGYLVYLAGELRRHFLSYFGVAYLLKEPIAGIVLAGIGLVGLWRSKSTPTLSKWFILAPPAVLFLGMSLFADDLGIRYIIPALPFVYLLAGWGLAAILRAARRTRWAAGAVAVLCGWIVLAAAGIYPDHLSYFNEMACLPGHPGQIGLDGGSRCGPVWLDDSNVEWGGGLKQLKIWLDRNAGARTAKLALFTSFPPETYGIRCQKIPEAELAREPGPGLYVVSASFVARIPAMPGASDWMRRTRPAAIVAHSLYVYDIPPSP